MNAPQPHALRIPVSTYRVQLNPEFAFADAERIIPYLHALGVTDCYTSPYLKAVPGSRHGYDVVDPTTLNPELGTQTDYNAFVAALARHDMGHLLDVVPNHMGIAASANAWWLDVLENGPSSRYAAFFDIDWHPLKLELNEKVLLPILGNQYGMSLENQEILLGYSDGTFVIRYYDHTLPVAPKSYTRILTHRLDELIAATGAENPSVQELQSIVTAIGHLPARSQQDPASVAERYREKEIIKKRLAAVVRESPTVARFIEDNVRAFNGAKGQPGSFDSLHALLDDQAYRLADWRVASEEINYRRFFDVNELVALRMEHPDVFQKTHALIFELIRQGAVTGLRIDHVDGLYDPRDYLRQLQASAVSATTPHETGRPVFVVVEKILGASERVPEDWPVYGTTGYDFLNLVNGLFVEGGNERLMSDIYGRFTGVRTRFDELAYHSKQLIMQTSMASEINVLAHHVNLLSERNRRFRDFTLNSLTHAIREIIASFPVYRTYVTPDPNTPVSDRDRAYIRLAVAKAKRRNPALSGLVFDFVRDLLLKASDEGTPTDRDERVAFLMKFQQTTSPVTAKGVEDTAHYVYNRLLSLNEVGGDPERFGVEPRAFHDAMLERAARWPYALSITSTHDTKRGEDVRARLNVLSEIPKEWRARLGRWHRLNRKKRIVVDDQPTPDPNEECFLYQTLIGSWPSGDVSGAAWDAFHDRIQQYMTKALREAKVHTSWINPNQPYEDAVARFISTILDRGSARAFLEDIARFVARVSPLGIYNSLAQQVLKIAAPGVPDFYQGTELWDLSLVDPDNRRPVEFERRVSLVEDLQQRSAAGNRRALAEDLVRTRTDGRIKLFVIMTALRYRRHHAPLFLDGSYVPLDTVGARRRHVVAFARTHRDRMIIAAVPRLVATLLPDADALPHGSAVWGDTGIRLPPTRPDSTFHNLFTGEPVTATIIDGQPALRASEVFSTFPVSLLEGRT
ncbi:MAG: malto-oligosyltrehalose synthase [Nitrospirota bacterium]